MRPVIVVLALGTLIGLTYFHLGTVAARRERITELESRQTLLRAAATTATAERDAIRAQLTAAQSALPAAPTAADPFAGKVSALKTLLEQQPEQSIPELALLEPQDWIEVAGNARLDTDEGVAHALHELRLAAKRRFGPKAAAAVKAHLAERDRTLPADLSGLRQHFDASVTAAMLERYELLIPTSASEAVRAEALRRNQLYGERGSFDARKDSWLVIGAGPTAWYSGTWHEMTTRRAQTKWRLNHPGETYTGPDDLAPYLPPADLARLKQPAPQR